MRRCVPAMRSFNGSAGPGAPVSTNRSTGGSRLRKPRLPGMPEDLRPSGGPRPWQGRRPPNGPLSFLMNCALCPGVRQSPCRAWAWGSEGGLAPAPRRSQQRGDLRHRPQPNHRDRLAASQGPQLMLSFQGGRSPILRSTSLTGLTPAGGSGPGVTSRPVLLVALLLILLP